MTRLDCQNFLCNKGGVLAQW